jgi:GGDEF domain-containing protein
MRPAPIPDNDTERLAAVRASYCAYAPREERFDRLTRTLRRLLHVPIAMISIVEEDEQWLRSVQGLYTDHTPRDISFCGHVVASNEPLLINDTWTHLDFHDNPLVLGHPGIRSYVGWPLELAPGLAAGSLCAIDTMPRDFGDEDLTALKDLARIAEGELRLHAQDSLQKALLMRLDLAQRRNALDPATGCWNIRGFRELLAIAVPQARAEGTHLALCTLRLSRYEALLARLGAPGREAAMSVLVQLVRERLPPDGALARLGESDFCALVPALTGPALDLALFPLQVPQLSAILPDGSAAECELSVRVTRLADLPREASASQFWAAALATQALL